MKIHLIFDVGVELYPELGEDLGLRGFENKKF